MVIRKIFYLNSHLFRGTLPAFFYRKLQYNDNDRCNRICDYILSENYDILLLSEIWSSSMKLKIMMKLIHAYPYHYIPPRNCKWYKVGPEQIILSKEIIEECRYENLNNLSSWDQFSVKKICSCVSGNYFICTTHFDTGYTSENLDQLREYITKYSGERKVILCGDLNIAESNDNTTLTGAYNNMTNVFDIIGMRDSFRILNTSITNFPYYTVNEETNTVANYFSNGGTNKTRLDYFFTRGIIPTGGEVIILPLSDHYGISLTIQ